MFIKLYQGKPKRLLYGRCVCLFFCLVPIAKAQTLQLTPVALPRQLSLPQAEELLMQRNLAVVTNRQQLDVSQALRLIAGYKPNPTLQVGAEQFPIHSPVPGSVPRFFSTNSDAGAEPTWTMQVGKVFERGGKREFRMAQADAQIDAAKAQILDTFRTQLLQLRQAFMAAMLARENLSVAQTMDNDYQRTENLTITRVNSGDLAAMEVFRVKAGRLPFQQAVVDAQNAYEQGARDIMNLLNASTYTGPATQTQPNTRASLMPIATAGQAPQASFAPAIEVIGDFTTRALEQSLGALRDLALTERPDVQVARNNLRAAQSAVRLAQAQRSRDVSVALEYQRVGTDSALGVIAQAPIFLYNNQKASIAQAVGQEHVAEAQLRAAETQALTDVEKAFQAYTAAQKSMALYSSENLIQVDQLRKVVDYSYRRGEASLFELLDAQRTARQAQIGFNQARANYQLSLWQMEAAIGRPLNQP